MNGTMNKLERAPPINVLLIDDRSADVRDLRETLVKGRIANRLHCIGNPLEALAYLDRSGPYALAPDVDVVLLSASLAHDGAAGLLAAIRDRTRLRSLPVIVLTDADAKATETASVFRDAQAVLTKPVGLNTLTTTLKELETLGAANEHKAPKNTHRNLGMEKRKDD
jgi:response regulator RpfG family c-di-GMP phosphodiesterase